MMETTTVLQTSDKTSSIGGNFEMLLFQNTKTRTGGTPLTPLQHLLSYLMHIRLTRTIQRNLLMVESAQAALSDKNEVSHGIRVDCVVQCEMSIGSNRSMFQA
jgi:hypothetical protein